LSTFAFYKSQPVLAGRKTNSLIDKARPWSGAAFSVLSAGNLPQKREISRLKALIVIA
jgi:hypothetical protein